MVLFITVGETGYKKNFPEKSAWLRIVA